MTLLLPLLVIAWALSPRASPECVFLRDDRTIRCQNSTLPEVSESMHVLTAVVRNRPRALEAESCGKGPNYLPRLPFENSGVEMVRIQRCDIQDLEEGAFQSVAFTLRDLDLSHNRLEHVPEALRGLDALQRLNLRHNRIMWVRMDGPISSLSRLRELEFGHNHLGFTEDNEEYYYKGSIKVSHLFYNRSKLVSRRLDNPIHFVLEMKRTTELEGTKKKRPTFAWGCPRHRRYIADRNEQTTSHLRMGECSRACPISNREGELMQKENSQEMLFTPLPADHIDNPLP
ncbi:hypothetical protein TNCT_229391 [Trichonephila clavata]|uniref:Leucine-rich repeat protein n=1 Tax=Trichonephila clavata TaxID=2740835 RepID=A0A8X6HMX1_TRICU|nr:hypothetical protein TNCT_229391 [Trichonephila clavata]